MGQSYNFIGKYKSLIIYILSTNAGWQPLGDTVSSSVLPISSLPSSALSSPACSNAPCKAGKSPSFLRRGSEIIGNGHTPASLCIANTKYHSLPSFGSRGESSALQFAFPGRCGALNHELVMLASVSASETPASSWRWLLLLSPSAQRFY